MNESIALQHGRTRVMVAPTYGGRIAQLELFDGSWLPLLHDDATTPPAARDPLAWGCYPMAPWPNRIADGRFEFEGRTYELPLNDGRHALHGLAFDKPWQVVEQRPNGIVMHVALDNGPWPWRAACSHEITVLDDGMSMTLELHSLDDAPFPAGLAWHPWFRRDVRPDSDACVLVNADEIYELDRMIPTGRMLPVDKIHDLRVYRALRDRRLDACYADPRSPLRIRWNDIELTMRSSANITHAVIYTPAHAVCIEPQTCAIDAFNLAARGFEGTGMAVVPPGGVLRATTEWRWTIEDA